MQTNKQRQRAELFLMGVIADEGFDSTLEGLEVTGGGPGSVSCKLPVTKKLQNRYSTLHGGCIATLVDVVGSAALVTLSDKGGVSLAINTLYLNPMPGGGTVVVEAKLVKLGRDVASIEVALRDDASGALVATGTHVKKLVGASDLSQFFRALEQQQQPDAVETQQSTQLPASQPALQQQQPGQQRQHKALKQQQQDSTCSKDRLPPRSRL